MGGYVYSGLTVAILIPKFIYANNIHSGEDLSSSNSMASHSMQTGMLVINESFHTGSPNLYGLYILDQTLTDSVVCLLNVFMPICYLISLASHSTDYKTN